MDPKNKMSPVVLTIAGSDSLGSAGIQADLKTMNNLDCYGASALTALTAQNTFGVKSAIYVTSQFLKEQLEAISEDLSLDAVKIGMIGSSELVSVIAHWIRSLPKTIPIILDPVLISTSGASLSKDEKDYQLKLIDELFPLSTLITPNWSEAYALILARMANDETSKEKLSKEKMGELLLELGAKNVLIKGGDLDTRLATDTLYQYDHEKNVRSKSWSSPKLETNCTHGTGCTLGSAIASFIAHGFNLEEAITKGKNYIFRLIEQSDLYPINKNEAYRPLHHQKMGGYSFKKLSDIFIIENATLMDKIFHHPFNQDLLDGTVEKERFFRYLVRDSLYLDQYSIALKAVAEKATDKKIKDRFLTFSKGAKEGAERIMQEAYLKGIYLDQSVREEIERCHELNQYGHYLKFFQKEEQPFLESLVSILPCFWVYAELGKKMSEKLKFNSNLNSKKDHPYSAWIETYADGVIQEETMEILKYLDDLTQKSSDQEKEKLIAIFREGVNLEFHFWDNI